jgi:HD-like signal output (HDOD) protein
VKKILYVDGDPRITQRAERLLHPSSDRVGEIISHDLSMSAKVLQLVNSPYFGLSRQINDPTQAAVILGLETIRDGL